MGMDVYGKGATSDKGNYFRNNIWWWHPLWDYCCEVSFVAQQVENGHTNEGDGLDAEDAVTLAETLQAEIDSGRCKAFEEAYRAKQAALPDEECMFCSGSGTRFDAHVQGTCNGCQGTGKMRPISSNCPFSVENVQEFVDFLRDCGGFEIC